MHTRWKNLCVSGSLRKWLIQLAVERTQPFAFSSHSLVPDFHLMKVMEHCIQEESMAASYTIWKEWRLFTAHLLLYYIEGMYLFESGATAESFLNVTSSWIFSGPETGMLQKKGERSGSGEISIWFPLLVAEDRRSEPRSFPTVAEVTFQGLDFWDFLLRCQSSGQHTLS